MRCDFYRPYILISVYMSIKQISVKQAERWLEKLKNENSQSYKELSKSLRKYEKTEDDYECYVKINHTLLAHTELTKELNNFMEDVNKFVVNKPEDEKIKEFLAYVKKNRFDIFSKIIELINDLSKSKGENPLEISKSLKPRLKDIVEGDKELERITEEALDLTGEEIISRKNLEHLKSTKLLTPVVQEEKETTKQIAPPKVSAAQKAYRTYDGESLGRQANRYSKPVLIGPFANPSEQRGILKQIQKMVDSQTFDYIMKVTKIYYLNIITRNEAFELLAGVPLDELYMECLKDILDSRETERRKTSDFKPLSDMAFNNCQRASPSYVPIPSFYSINSSAKPDWVKAIVNECWVSVPIGSQESENFSVRNKNSNEINLLKAEDERYEFDLYMRRLIKTLEFLEQVIDEKVQNDEELREKLINKILGLNTLQTIYKNCHREQKQEIEWFLKIADFETCRIFRDRVLSQVNQLKNIKEIHAIKNWSQIASKNFFKALDLKGFEFKKNEKEKMKSTFFISDLQERQKLLENGGESKNGAVFEEKKQFFTILNSFESSSRTQKCMNRVLPQIETFDLKKEHARHLYPTIIMSFEDQAVCQSIYSLLLFYIDSFTMTEPEKLRCKFFLEQFFVSFLGWTLPLKYSLNESFEQQKFHVKINGGEVSVDIKSWINEQKQQSLLMEEEEDSEKDKEEKRNKKMGLLKDTHSSYSFMPTKSDEKVVLYGSENLYTLCRFVYALYERLIRMKEVAENPEKIELFKILLYSCVKAKESSKFQESLNVLFGKYAYLFSTIYKLLDNLMKSLSIVSGCPLTNYSFKCYKEESEDVYFVLLNRFCLNSNLNNSKLSRLTYHKKDKVIYFNYLDSYYKSDDTSKDMLKKRAEIAKGIEIYTIDSFGLEKKKRKFNEMLQDNEIEYIFQGSTIKMLNHSEHEDLMQFVGRKAAYTKTAKREVKRAHKMLQRCS